MTYTTMSTESYKKGQLSEFYFVIIYYTHVKHQPDEKLNYY